MAKAKRLPSGQWRTQVYSHSIPLYDNDGKPIVDEKGKPKEKRIYESFTADGKKESEYMAAEFALNKKRKARPENLTLSEAVDKYINSKDALLSPKTVSEYRKMKKVAFKDIMDIKVKDITEEVLQEAINREAKRNNEKATKNPKPISAKTVKNEYGLIATVLAKYNKNIDLSEIQLPAKQATIKELLPPETIFDIVQGSPIELPVMLAMWLSFSMSEIRGLKRTSITSDGYIMINQVIVDVDCKPVEKKQAKVFTRIRKHKIPVYIKGLIDALPEDQEYLVTLSGIAINRRFSYLLKKNGQPHMTFHDLRHVNASVMALLRVPDQYAMERGGWKTDSTMKKVYTHTFSDQRQAVDETIDNYFSAKIQHEMQHENHEPA